MIIDTPGNVRIGKSDPGLSKASVINVSQLLTLDRSLLTDRIKSLPGKGLEQVNEGLQLVLGI